MIVTIDGPAGAGKSTVTRRLADKLGFDFLDTGAMYRAVTLMAIERGISLSDPEALGALARSLTLHIQGDRLWVDGQDVTSQIRDPEVSRKIGPVADAVPVRQHLVGLQREWAARGNYVCEGRDQGTVAFPDAQCKIFLTASPEERATRRAAQLQAAGIPADWNELLREQETRDQEDRSRPVGRLQQAPDAIEFNTDGLTLDEVVEQLYQLVCRQLGKSPDTRQPGLS